MNAINETYTFDEKEFDQDPLFLVCQLLSLTVYRVCMGGIKPGGTKLCLGFRSSRATMTFQALWCTHNPRQNQALQYTLTSSPRLSLQINYIFIVETRGTGKIPFCSPVELVCVVR